MYRFLNCSWIRLAPVVTAGLLFAAAALWWGMNGAGSHVYARPQKSSSAIAQQVDGRVVIPAPRLEITSIVEHGDIVEVKGRTDPGTVVMINGETAVTMFSDSEFRHFIGPLPPGTTVVTVTCQNEHGGVHTQQLAISVD